MTSQAPDFDIAVTDMWLQIGGRTIGLTHVARDFVILEEAVQLPTCEGLVVMIVNGERREFPVRLPQRVSVATKRIEIAEVEQFALVAA